MDGISLLSRERAGGLMTNIPPLRGFVIFDTVKRKWHGGGTGPMWSDAPYIFLTPAGIEKHLRYQVQAREYQVDVMIFCNYDNAVIVDLTTMQEWDGFKPADYVMEYAEKKSAKQNNKPIRFLKYS